MRALFLLAALNFASPSVAAAPNSAMTPFTPAPQAAALQDAEKAIPPLRLRDPVVFDGLRRLAPIKPSEAPRLRPALEIG